MNRLSGVFDNKRRSLRGTAIPPPTRFSVTEDNFNPVAEWTGTASYKAEPRGGRFGSDSGAAAVVAAGSGSAALPAGAGAAAGAGQPSAAASGEGLHQALRSYRMDSAVQISGHLFKKSTTGSGKAWKERYVVLKDSFILWYDALPARERVLPRLTFDLHPKGVLPCDGVQMETVRAGPTPEMQSAFRLFHPSFGARTLLLCAPNDSERDRWMTAIRAASSVTASALAVLAGQGDSLRAQLEEAKARGRTLQSLLTRRQAQLKVALSENQALHDTLVRLQDTTPGLDVSAALDAVVRASAASLSALQSEARAAGLSFAGGSAGSAGGSGAGAGAESAASTAAAYISALLGQPAYTRASIAAPSIAVHGASFSAAPSEVGASGALDLGAAHAGVVGLPPPPQPPLPQLQQQQEPAATPPAASEPAAVPPPPPATSSLTTLTEPAAAGLLPDTRSRTSSSLTGGDPSAPSTQPSIQGSLLRECSAASLTSIASHATANTGELDGSIALMRRESSVHSLTSSVVAAALDKHLLHVTHQPRSASDAAAPASEAERHSTEA